MLVSLPQSTSRFSTVVEKLWILRQLGPGPSMNLWKQVLDRLEQTVDRTEYENWFAPSRFLAQRGDTIDVSVPSQRYVEEIRERFGPRIRSILNDISLDRLNLHLVADAAEPSYAVDIAPPPPVDLPLATFNPRYRFETFVVGKSNELAFAASRSEEHTSELQSRPHLVCRLLL